MCDNWKTDYAKKYTCDGVVLDSGEGEYVVKGNIKDNFNKNKILNQKKLITLIKKREIIIFCHSSNVNKKKILSFLKSGSIISLISDAGTPCLSDPGSILINECLIVMPLI